MNVAEKFTRALQSSNLKNDELNCNLDIVLAVAMSDNSGIGSLLWRLKYHDEKEVFGITLDRWSSMIVKKAGKENWEVKDQAKQIARNRQKIGGFPNTVAVATTP